ncbi:MAG: hypothetical protein OEZ04_01475 [Nitrospinota bacterium]|nr:hypothetical protein [Nitrospinota bacterium]
MKSTRQSVIAQMWIITLCMLFVSSDVLAQAEEWKTETADDGKVTVRSNISTRTDENGKEQQLVQYIATTTDSAGIQKYILLLKDVSRHKDFLDETETRIVKTNSDNEWVLYYYTDATWPLSDTDIVTIMKYSEDKAEGMATFTLTAAPSMYENKKGVNRYNYYNMEYSFKDIGDGKVELTLSAKCSPIDRVPEWMIKAAFPGVVNDTLQKMIKLAKSS